MTKAINLVLSGKIFAGYVANVYLRRRKKALYLNY